MQKVDLYRAMLSAHPALRWRHKQVGSIKSSSEPHYGIFQLLVLFPGDHSPLISMKMPLARGLLASLQVLAVIRASFLFSPGLSGQQDRCQAPEQRWKPITAGGIMHHTNMCLYPSLSLPLSLSLHVCVCLTLLTFSLNLWLFKCIHGSVHSSFTWTSLVCLS